MRRLGLIFVALVFVFAVAACGGEEEAAPEPDTTEGTLTTETEETTDTETEGEPAEGDPANGKTVYASAGCGSCHVLADAGTSGSVGPNLDESQPSYELVVDRVTNGQGAMPSFRDQLSEQQINDVAAYVSGAAGG